MRGRLAVALACLAAPGLTACGRAEQRGAETNSTTLTVYVSLPFQGLSGPTSTATANGARLALQQVGGRVGGLAVKLAVLDSSRTDTLRSDPEQTADNARVAVRDRTAIAYVGDGPSGATAISLPILNAAGIAQVSPTSADSGLTQALGGEKGEPEKYYPSGVRSFARTVPSGRVQVRALRRLLAERDCRRPQLIDDGDVDGRGLVRALARSLDGVAPPLPDAEMLRVGDDPVVLARETADRAPGCVVVAAQPSRRTIRLLDALHAAAPRLDLIGTAGLAVDEVTKQLSPGTQRRLTLVAPGGPLSADGRRIATAYRAAFGLAPRTSSFYGYEAMQRVLDAVRRAGPAGNNRAAVIRALLPAPERAGPFGAAALTADGDTTDTSTQRLDVRAGRLVAGS